ncbi:5-formyltetrahydrofolate cyclo-ligase [Limosilactobacillus caecicola]|uniref:5-formyltetrahydrofolate cyclo-ligase n=1 Tax=Limosilactobacillus caecicola TaxID=2941332 RepID=UPI00203C4C1F|nr:5-formyltetrahydrofolate cyclo-ligase [Limosilactobacillus caecicola]
MYTKKEMRQAYIARLQQLDLNTRLQEEKQIASRLYDQPEWFNADTIAITISQSFEINTAPIILHARHKGQRVVVPRTLPNWQMEFVTLDEDTEFDESHFGVLEPVGGQVVTPDDIDLMVVPGVAFTPAGKRLGFGGGYYDRYLADYGGPKVALAFNTQVADDDEWPVDEHDIPVDRVIGPNVPLVGE